MNTFLTTTTSKGVGHYVGETKKQLRDGFGVYNYSNRFFRYEGEWVKGKKHGHGKLLMADGSFYEGQFCDGEIQGHGYRYWASTGNNYTGQFIRGELNGHGIMKYADCETYEGEWMNNQREGQGRLTEADSSIYEGSFHHHKKHGHGIQIYSNGDHYEGDWVNGMKQGSGVMKYADGSIYAGQWWSDVFNGEGSLIHSSGMSYEGMWVSGHPEVEAVQLCIVGEDHVEVSQGSSFGFQIECISSDGDIVQDNGRLLQVTAGVKVGALKPSDLDEERTMTPFGFEVEPYPVTEMLVQLTGDTSPALGLTPAMDPSHTAQSASPPVDAVANDVTKPLDQVQDTDSPETDDKERDSYEIDGTGLDKGQAEELAGSSTTSLPAPVPPVRTVEGKGLFENIYLPPLPPGVRSWTSLTSVTSGTSVTMDKRGSIVKWKKGSTPINQSIQKASISPDSMKKKKDGSLLEVGDKADSKKKKEKKEVDKMEEKLCRQGDYVLIVEDVTSPPFLDTVLQPAFLHVKVTPKLKRAKSKIEKKH